MNKGKIIILGVVSVALLFAAYALKGYLAGLKKNPPVRDARSARKYVSAIPIIYADQEAQILAFGRVGSAQPLRVTAEVPGKILQGSVTLKAGAKFKKGQLLFHLDDQETKLALQADKSNFLKTLSNALPDMKVDYPESFEKWKSYFYSIDIDKALPALPKVANAQEKTYLATRDILTNYYKIKSSEERLGKYDVYAPYNGSITQVLAEKGAYVNTGAAVLDIIKTDHLELKAPLTVSEAAWINIGMEVKLFTEDGTQEWQGKVERIADIVNPNTQSIDVFIRVMGNGQRVYDGMYLKALVAAGKVENCMSISRKAVFQGDKVFTIKGDTLLSTTTIEVIKTGEDSVLFRGVKEGLPVVNEPVLNGYNNMPVRIGS